MLLSISLFGRAGYQPSQILFDALFIDFDVNLMEKVAQAESGTAPSSEMVLLNWEKGKGRLLNSFKLLTRSGVASSAETVQEIIYATEFKVSEAPVSKHEILFPDTFETREVGTILYLTPTVGPDRKLIDIAISMELCDGPEWIELKSTAKSASGEPIQTTVPQPIFKSRNLSTSIIVHNGTTAVLGGLTDKDSGKIVYLLLTATLVDTAGYPLAAEQ
jgi:hypothetical protein